MIKKYIKRPIYIKKLLPFIDKDIIKVITGQRRTGKSYLLFQIMDEIKKQHKNANIIYINKELHEFESIANSGDLIAHIKANAKPKIKNYVFIDEIQDISQFEKALRSLKAEGRYDIYCTGSNANLLSGELATYLSGRYIAITVQSLSYAEFLVFHKIEDSDESLIKYIKYGGLPYLKNLELNDAIAYDYLKNVYNTILLKDVVARHNIRNVAFLNTLVEFLADNTGSMVSAKKISDFLKSQKINISPNIVLNYLSFLEQAFFAHKIKRKDVSGKKIFETNYKYYFEDIGLRHSIISYRQTDIGKIMENLIFAYLKTLGYDVTIGEINGKEIDFVAEKQGKRIYIQSAYVITDENKDREFNGLLSIKDNYPKYVVSMDSLKEETDYKGIRHVHLRDFLMGRAEV